MMRAMHIGTMTLALHPRPLCTSRCTTVVGPTIVTAYARIPVMTSRMTDLFLGITRRFPRGNAELQDEDYVASTISTIPDHGIRLNHDNTPLMNLQRRQRKIAQRYRSFRRRQGSITKGQRRALRDFWPTHGLEMDFARRWDFDDIFTVPAKQHTEGQTSRPAIVLDIGFGHGDSLLSMATVRPNDRFVGIEVHKPGIAAALSRLEEEGMSNVKIAQGDVLTALMDHVRDRSLDECYILFPDPFPQDHEVERRLVRPFLLALLSRKLRIGGTFHVATDVDVYAEHVSKVVSAGHELVERLPDELPTNTNLYWRGGETSERPAWRPLTDYERKAREAGRRVRDFRYRLAEESSPLIGAAGDARPE